MSDKKVIEVDKVTYKINGRAILKDVSLSVYKGKTFALLGHNGSGKSTVIDILTGTIKPNSGKVFVLGSRFSRSKRQVSVLYDGVPIFPLLRVNEVLNYISSIYKTDKEKIQQLVVSLGMEKLKDKKTKLLSKGEKKKLGIILALMGDPEVLILDEPTSDLDPMIRETCWSLFKSQGRSVFFTSHLWEEAEKYADNISFISDGVIKADSNTPAELLSKKYLPYEKKIVVSGGDLKSLQALKKHTYVRSKSDYIFWMDSSDEIKKILDNQRIDYKVGHKDLKDVYLYITNKE